MTTVLSSTSTADQIPALSSQIHADLAWELHRAEQQRTQLRHFSSRFPEMGFEDSYRISQAWAEIKKEEGQQIIGHKIGLTSRAMQMSSQIDEPDFGTLFDEMLYESGQSIDSTRFILPRVEVELAFILDKPLEGPRVSVADVYRATEYVTPALEIIDARIEQHDRETGAPRRVFDTISDNAANAGIVLGAAPVKVDSIDLRWVGSLLHKNGVIEESGLAAGVLGNPAIGIAWLARRLHSIGERLEAGETVLAGSFTRPVSISPGDVVHAEYGTLGSLSFALT
ncbi:2-keto-4-pentenoate hydratase [Corynebacterium occultum]|uniref:2-keto-4-pentenoate hydratase n=1 Tax=Corynebacterium occultum TaxID=2675219 RepID=A0A6B8W8G0_9CORY|nr:2-oxo-hepta-3-ene-1,7-dioic acid hydratase [Corynebacterium occultum]QGU08227.1 2-keto-4-pentenoate hydratase [Corynebacterium occultum]